ncbi:MAG: aminopeptidase P N-terminal domain-containing protein [Deltaproteobacteria bacterium]|nr:aminopeptidase P N-terminal domain-containing protein [Deltaproteobacteria bacterium]
MRDDQAECKERRKSFLKFIKGAVAVLPANPENAAADNIKQHPYRQESNLYYLTGFTEPKSIALLAPNSKQPFQLFVRPRDKSKELWEGRILGPEAAKTQFGADLCFPSTQPQHFDDAFIQAMQQADRLYYRLGIDDEMDRRIYRLLASARDRLGRTGRPFWPIFDPDDVLSDMRQIKSKREIEVLQISANIGAEAHVTAMRSTKPGMFEYEVEAMLFHAFRMRGALTVSFPSIVASGPNACVLHYVSNERQMTDKDLVLIDAGCLYEYSSSDITRCFPVSGRFSKEQKEIYQAVLTAQKAGIALARPGSTMMRIHERVVEVLVEELKKLKLLKGPSKSIIKNNEYLAYYPHRTGHWLGIDTHDVGRYYHGDYSNARKLAPGMVFTVEPGLYCQPIASTPAKYRGIGVRIEDDVVITQDGCKVLTSAVPKEIDEIEALCAQA